MAKDKAPKKKKSAKKASDDSDDTDPLVVILDDTVGTATQLDTAVNFAEVDAVKQPKKSIVAAGQRYWLVPKGHRRKARPVEVAVAVGGEDSVTIRCLDNGETRRLPRAAFATAGSSGVLRA